MVVAIVLSILYLIEAVITLAMITHSSPVKRWSNGAKIAAGIIGGLLWPLVVLGMGIYAMCFMLSAAIGSNPFNLQ